MAQHAIVVVCDALHLGCVGCFGSDWVETPAIDRLADEGFVFDQCYPEAPTVGGWWRTGLTGSWPIFSAPSVVPPLLTTLASAGVAIGVFWPFGLAPRPTPQDWCIAGPADAPLAAQFAAAGAWLQTRREQPTLTWLQLDLALGNWSPPDQFIESAAETTTVEEATLAAADADLQAARTTYAARVAYYDAVLGTYLDWLQDAGIYDNALVVVTSDQGFPLGEHGVIGPERPWLYEERAHVPLIVRGGGVRAARSSALVQTADLAGTLAEHFGLGPLESSAVPLQTWIRGESPPMRRYVCSGVDDVEYAIGTRRWRLLLPAGKEGRGAPRPRMLFAKPEDRWEVSDVAATQPAIADALELQLRRHLDAVRRNTLDLLLPLAEDV